MSGELTAEGGLAHGGGGGGHKRRRGMQSRPPAVTCRERLMVVPNYVLERGLAGGEAGIASMSCPRPTSTGLRLLASPPKAEEGSSKGG